MIFSLSMNERNTFKPFCALKNEKCLKNALKNKKPVIFTTSFGHSVSVSAFRNEYYPN
ncbi:hypothetical protein [Vibrio vulnificus YJ016]|uniref:Uncharacterized protein n=1 Tax=Vibrio vulnificus (strain YJ016) TaxID=196600 RepID=Q7MG28_VIBVY|nr:hypothetical protein [Vibrio vulnificus YJ016]